MTPQGSAPTGADVVEQLRAWLDKILNSENAMFRRGNTLVLSGWTVPYQQMKAKLDEFTAQAATTRHDERVVGVEKVMVAMWKYQVYGRLEGVSEPSTGQLEWIAFHANQYVTTVEQQERQQRLTLAN